MGKIWHQGDLNITQEFNEANYSKLLEYSETNELHLIQLLGAQDFETLKKSLKFSTGILRFFEYNLKEDKKELSAFMLGKLFGYVECLNYLSYEDSSNLLALKAFYVASAHMQFIDEYKLRKLLLCLYSQDSMTKSLLLNQGIGMESLELDYALSVFERFAIVNCYDAFLVPKYNLTDAGRRIATQFKHLPDDK